MLFMPITPEALLLSAAAAQGLGYLRYSLFRRPGEPRKGWRALAASAALTLVTAFFMSIVIIWAGVFDPVFGAVVGLIVALGFVVTALGQAVLAEGRPWRLYLIDAGHWIAALTAMGAVQGYLR